MKTNTTILRQLIIVTALTLPLISFSQSGTALTSCAGIERNVRSLQAMENAGSNFSETTTGINKIDTSSKSGYSSSVRTISFDRLVSGKKSINVQWTTVSENTGTHFEVERSFDNKNFKTIAIILDGFNTSDNQKTFMYKDNSNSIKSQTTVYYRIIEVDMYGNETNTNELAVR